MRLLPRRRRRWASRSAKLCVAATLGGLILAACSNPPLMGGGASSLQSTYVQVAQDVSPSVVQITTSVGLGSGVVYDNRGDIVTNDHVVAGSTSFKVQLPAGGGKLLAATLVGAFPQDDLAVIRVSGASNLHPARFGDSSKLAVGDLVLAVGNPLGLSRSVTDGIVSATGRTVTEPVEPGSPGATLPDAIQTSAAINPGNSGGALVDLSAQVIGVPTLAAVDPELGGTAPGIGFAIPSNLVKSVAAQLIANGSVTKSGRAALGVDVFTVVRPNGKPAGAGVIAVVPGGPADQAGIVPGDIIVAVAGVPTPTAEALAHVLAQRQPGQSVKVKIVTPTGATRTVSVLLGSLPNS